MCALYACDYEVTAPRGQFVHEAANFVASALHPQWKNMTVHIPPER